MKNSKHPMATHAVAGSPLTRWPFFFLPYISGTTSSGEAIMAMPTPTRPMPTMALVYFSRPPMMRRHPEGVSFSVNVTTTTSPKMRFGALGDNPASSGARFSLRATRSSYLRLRYEGERRVSRSRLAARGATPTLYI